MGNRLRFAQGKNQKTSQLPPTSRGLSAGRRQSIKQELTTMMEFYFTVC